MNNIALFGCGTGLELYWELSPQIQRDKVKVIFDNAPRVDFEYGIPVLAPFAQTCTSDQYGEILITSRHYIDIYFQLLTFGVPEKKIKIYGGLLAI